MGADIRLRGGEYDILQSTDEHFVAAGRIALQEALARSGTRLLEPWWTVAALIPEECVGDVLADLSSHRGRILGVEPTESCMTTGVSIRALCPHRELRTFAARLQGLTGGRGRFSTEVSHYEPLPRHLLKEAIAASPYRSSPRLIRRDSASAS
jgi:elongation factor G